MKKNSIVLFAGSFFLLLIVANIILASEIDLANKRFSLTGEKAILDSKTGLQWKEGPDKPLSWDETQIWIKSLGGSWRAPTLKELETLYVDNSVRIGGKSSVQNGKTEGPFILKLDEIFKNNCSYWVWSTQYNEQPDLAQFYYFNLGETGFWPKDKTTWCLRCIAVKKKEIDLRF